MFNKKNWEKNDGPIPGENFTSNTKNYPWHRPPEVKNMDEAVDLFIDRVVKDKKRGPGLMTLLEMGVPISTVTSIFVKQGIMGGKWTPDYAILVAGPIARIIEMMANSSGIDYVKGWEDEDNTPTASYFKDVEPDPEVTPMMVEETEEVVSLEDQGGLLTPPTEQEVPTEVQ